jgi:dolichol-phosphate mannosyltransferase
MQPNIALSIVLPVYNEAQGIGILIKEISAVFEKSLPKPGEIIIVDDASNDTSVTVIEEIARELAPLRRPQSQASPVEITLITHPDHRGQSHALMNGLAAARGDLIVSLDADGQYDPADIPRFIEKLDAFDMICGVRKNRADGSARIGYSKIGNALRNRLTGDSTKDAGCTFRIMRKTCVAALLPFKERLFECEFFFHPLILRRKGFRVVEMEVSHRPRLAGKSKYKLVRGRALRGLYACMRVRRQFNIQS